MFPAGRTGKQITWISVTSVNYRGWARSLRFFPEVRLVILKVGDICHYAECEVLIKIW